METLGFDRPGPGGEIRVVLAGLAGGWLYTQGQFGVFQIPGGIRVSRGRRA